MLKARRIILLKTVLIYSLSLFLPFTDDSLSLSSYSMAVMSKDNDPLMVTVIQSGGGMKGQGCVELFRVSFNGRLL